MSGVQHSPHGDVDKHEWPLTLRGQDQHLGRRLPLGPILHALR
jgi:hypothetical protein